MKKDNKPTNRRRPAPLLSYSNAVSGKLGQDVAQLSLLSSSSINLSTPDSDESASNSPLSSADSLQTAIDEPLELPPLAKGPPADEVVAAYSLATAFTPDSPPNPILAFRDVRPEKPSTSTFNPKAAAFVPSPSMSDFSALPTPSTSALASFPSTLPVPRAPVPQPPRAVEPHRPWTYPYTMGMLSAAPERRAFYARGVVSLRDWTGPRLQDLAWCLTWDATEPRARGGVAAFAAALAGSFREVYGEDLASAFEWHVRDYALQTFCGWWDPQNASSVVREGRAPRQHVDCALSLARYVGQLFGGELLSAPHVHLCLNILVTNLSALEHILAVQDILSQGNAQLCEGDTQRRSMREFLSAIEPKLKTMPDDASLKGARFDQAQVQSWFRDISGIVNRWLDTTQ
ncbi:hypothetical protein BV25DRAFT_956008 [Artomyces pyxidatus]|uniref:Uncharacterized protein n=1 Tax=Artomyces pyxidatus TaxID=48021 RepID=A0ACB8SVA3_9AGAM|nr:hypothetical protein BV25DRAFT_956008 [Artomyces pyxidatus]